MLVVELNRVNRVPLALAAGLAIALGGSVAHAQARVPLRLRYAAPEECPHADAFFAQVVARTTLAARATASEPATELRVTIRGVPGGHAGTLELDASGTDTARREVSAAECTQVVTALALITALAIDPNASTAPIPEAASVAVSTPKAVPAPTPAPSPAHDRFRVKLGVQLELLAAFAPDPSLLVRPFVELERERRAPFSYSFRLSAARAHATVTEQAGGAELRLWAARAEACPVHLPAGARVRFAPCLGFEVGQLHALGRGVVPAQHADRPWLAPEAIARLELLLFEALAVEVAGFVATPLVRDRFFVDADATVHRTAAIQAGGAVGVAFRFP